MSDRTEELADIIDKAVPSTLSDFRYRYARAAAEAIIAAGWTSPDDPAHARMYRALAERAERAEAKVARVEALAADWLSEVDWSDGRNNYGDNEAYEKCARQLSAALAEPERDEESAEGSCKPGTCDAPVMCSTDAPCPRNEEGGR